MLSLLSAAACKSLNSFIISEKKSLCFSESQPAAFVRSFPGYTVHNTSADGNCFFSALAHQLGRPMSDATFIRAELITYIRNHHQELVSMPRKFWL